MRPNADTLNARPPLDSCRADAETYGTPLNDLRYKLLTEYMREEAGKFLQVS